MSYPLEKVTTVNQTSMGSTRLPLEIQQQIYSYLEPDTFYAARNVCKWWRFASTDALTLHRQLQKLPIQFVDRTSDASNRELDQLFQEAAYTLMLGTRVVECPPTAEGIESMPEAYRPHPASVDITATRRGSRMVTLNGRTIALFDLSGETPRTILQRPLNDLKETIGSGPWLKPATAANHELALSSSGKLLAVAQERTIQIYDLDASEDSFTCNEYVASASGHYICGIDFEENDYLLRVRLSGRGTILYLGSPPNKDDAPAGDMAHWKNKGGLRHCLLDTSTMDLGRYGSEEDENARLPGLQLLRSFGDGYLFAAQKHGGHESSHYVLGHVRCSVPENGHSLTAERTEVVEVARLETFLSAWNYNFSGSLEHAMGLWEAMPSAHEHHPRFAMSPDGTRLVLSERAKKQVRWGEQAQLFAYRVPSEQRLRQVLEMKRAQSRAKWATLSRFLEGLECPRGLNAEARKRVQQRFRIGRIPLCLSTVTGPVTELRFESRQDVDSCDLVAVTADATRRWSFFET